MLLFTLGLNAQNLSGDWRVTPLTSKSFNSKPVVLDDDEFVSQILTFKSDGHFYSDKILKGDYYQKGDTLILHGLKEWLENYRKYNMSFFPRQRFESEESYNSFKKSFEENSVDCANDTFKIYSNQSNNTLLLHRIGSCERQLTSYEAVYYLHKDGTNESLSTGNLVGKWLLKDVDKNIEFAFEFTSDGNLLFQDETKKYQREDEYIYIDGNKLRVIYFE